ncbi:MAG: DoxX family protein [Desulfurella sp.]|uniref:DoxX family protein n=1 Tax=Desulfurella sp. TaxID=1962857 RepID=UPI003D0BA1AB
MINVGKADVSIFIIRLALSLTFIYHGSGILFNTFTGPGLVGFANNMHFPLIVAFLVGLAEFCGGISMLTGIFVRLGALGIMIVMFGAIIIVHLPHGFDLQKGGMCTNRIFTGSKRFCI